MKIKQFKLEDFKFKKTVGTGSFGRVKLAVKNVDGSYWAVKILKKIEILKLKQVDHMKSEITILSMIDHPFLIKMDGIAQDSKYLYILLEYIAGGELFTYLRTVQNLKHEDARFYAGQVVCMFDYLH